MGYVEHNTVIKESKLYRRLFENELSCFLHISDNDKPQYKTLKHSGDELVMNLLRLHGTYTPAIK